MKKFAVILSGSGVYDGSEIHEATLTLLAIHNNECKYQCYAPDIEQHHVINHITGEEMPEKRNVLIESARISRGDIKPLSEFRVEDCDAVILPGGFGAAKNLSSYAFDGVNSKVLPELKEVLIKMHEAKKPIGAMCISPVIIANVFKNTTITIGNDESVAKNIELMGSTHLKTSHGEVMADKLNMVFTTPCYMLDSNLVDIYDGANNLIESIIENLPK
ncbi:MAG: isoprenoid biosynthesis glyoxalase ElbB [Bacteroidales bacterium]|nr:isoprenoid biosynthesis glyoxalase ElbB [Bacteroidales bacterium]MDY0216456.1 isoprenoid biosynthesis glyoxalase ElbB [Bacteroidales bacterium]